MSSLQKFDDYTVRLFIESFEFNDNSEESELARVLFKTVDDCRDFYIGFFKRNKFVIDDLLDYREKRLSMADMSLYKFLWLCDYKIEKEVFEQVFLQPFSIDDIFLIEEAVNEERKTLEEIFTNFQKNPNENILKNVL